MRKSFSRRTPNTFHRHWSTNRSSPQKQSPPHCFWKCSTQRGEPVAHSTTAFLEKNFHWAMHAELAVVQVDAFLSLWVNFQHLQQPVRKEDRIRVDLCCPVMHQEAILADNLRPDSDKDVEVQCSTEFTTLAALQVAVHHRGVDTRGHLNDTVAVDSVLVASEKAHAFVELHRKQVLLVAARQHEGKAKQVSFLFRHLLFHNVCYVKDLCHRLARRRHLRSPAY
mmetsp:Transcript_34177/g.67272  ORF Transcript_34177/g.67272 Transcript_34177/m.67272 type:complete len:224 (+) Transcript_34177:60-731(+)